jgi:hypothetical protein
MPTVFELNVNTLVSVVVGLQFVAFGWRINREIPVGDAGRKTWFPIPDVINILSLLSVVLFCIVEPLASGQFAKSARVVLGVASVLLAFHPLCMVGHYRLFTAEGRKIYLKHGKDDYPYCTGAELAFSAAGLIAATIVGQRIWFSP